MGTSGHCKSYLRISILKRWQRSRIACSNILESMNKSPMIESLRGTRSLLAVRHHGAPDGWHLLAAFLVEGEALVINSRKAGIRRGAVTEQRIDPLGRTRHHVGIKLPLHCRHHGSTGSTCFLA